MCVISTMNIMILLYLLTFFCKNVNVYVSSFFGTELPIQGAFGTPGEVYNEGLCGGVASNKFM